ncbi:MAG: thermonuclease family protein [Acidilobaceae archaeon]|nr:thermonuclease family protein [Acidilobaceae archaeon]MCX8165350.1 thermonuclease family protein [Acidilobaceae archaeon]MDW7973776.1 thermonuclease family protein [Sulfolobales archaeon]
MLVLVFSAQIAEATEVIGRTTRVIDGDTIEVEIVEVKKEKYRNLTGAKRVRFADINAPELSTPEGQRSKEFLASLLTGKRVLLDVDDMKVTDKYNRIVAVVFLEHNATHYLNVNLFLVEKGYAAVRDYENEFNPSSWALYVRSTGDQGAAGGIPMELVALIALLLLLFLALIVVRVR